MPADRIYEVVGIGRGGLNLRDQPQEIADTELIDGLNWRLDERGALVKRQGFINLGIVNAQLVAEPLELGSYTPASGSNVLIAYLSNGFIFRSAADGNYIQAHFSAFANARPTMVQYQDKLYLSNGTDKIIQFDGTTAAAITESAGTAPKGSLIAVWRNRLWVAGDPAHPNRVYWSAAGNPLDWTNVATNYVDLPDPRGEGITALHPAPNPGATSDGADGLLVFKRRSTYRIIDDSDNVTGTVTGGANVLIDAGTGARSQRVVVAVQGRIWVLAPDGVYSTDGHSTLRLESGKLGRWIAESTDRAAGPTSVAATYQGSYLLALPRLGQTYPDVVLEFYASHPRDSEGNAACLAWTLPVNSMVNFRASDGEQLIFADSSQGDRLYLRRFNVGGSDLDGVDVKQNIVAYARTGAMNFGLTQPKRMRRARIDGRGNILLGVSADLATTIGQTAPFLLTTASRLWDPADQWGVGTWGGGGLTSSAIGWYTTRGRFFTFQISESSQAAGTGRTQLGVTRSDGSGAAVYAMEVRVTPLDRE